MKTAKEIADLLRAQAAANNNTVTLTDELLGTTGLDDLAFNELRRDPRNILLDIDPETIPQAPPATGFTLDARVPTGENAFLLLDGRDATIEFSVNGKVTVLLTVLPRSADGKAAQWTFSDSFPQLTLLPYDNLTIDTPALRLSTGAPALPKPGLYFDGTLLLEGIFATVLELTGAGAEHRLRGAFSSHAPDLSFELTADLGVPPLELGGVVKIEDVGVGVACTVITRKADSLAALPPAGRTSDLPASGPRSDRLQADRSSDLPARIVQADHLPADRSPDLPARTTQPPRLLRADNEPTTERLIQLYLGGKVTFENSSGTKLPLEIRANLPLNGSSSGALLFTILPADGFTTSLDRLGSLIAGQTWDNFFSGEAASLKKYFESFGLLGYSMLFWPRSGNITSIALSVGTDPDNPWPLWGDYTLALRADWQILFLGKDSVQTLLIAADFDFKQLQFAVQVRVPDLFISGTQSGGPLSYSLDALNRDLFDGRLPIPPGLLSVSVENFNIELHVPQKQLVIAGVVNASIAPFNTPLLAIRNMAVAVTIDSSQTDTQYTAQLNGQVSLGPITVQADATISNAEGVDTVFSMHLVNETVGSMLGHLIHLVDPGYNLDLGDPWNRLLDISLDALVLKVNLSKNIVELVYNARLFDLGFMSIEQIGLRYEKGSANAANSVRIELEGTFLGQKFGTGKDNPPLGWDPMNEAPPAVPGKGTSTFDLQYIGLGQHIGFGSDVPVETITQVMTALRESVIPREAGQLPTFGKNGLEFKPQSHWLIGAQFSVMDTVAISAIFNDPDLYGILIQLSGEKARIFKGLSFEILYRKVTDNIGVYHIELKLPDAMRSLQLGQVSITLPIVVLDIYTNGNFRVDFGFPKGLDFSNSFSVQVFPFVGFGGLYFALLDGATSSNVPKITNGTFSPVVEFGIALSLGVGKTVNAGILKGGITVTVIGIVEGVLAWFNPSDASPKETYYRVQGTVAIVGRLYAMVDFAIIQASVDVTAFASVTLTIEAHQPIFIGISAGVSLKLSVKIIFIRVHLSFRATIKAEFTIGRATQTPWRLASPGSVKAAQLRTLRGQDTLHAPLRMHAGMNRALLLAKLPQGRPLEWTPLRVLPSVQTIPVWAVSAFTKADTFRIDSIVRADNVVTVTTSTAHDILAGDVVTIAGVADASFNGTYEVSAGPTPRSFTFAQTAAAANSTGGSAKAGSSATRAIMIFAVETSVAEAADSHAQLKALAGDDPAGKPFNLLMQAMLSWGIAAENGGVLPDSVTALQLADLQQQLNDPTVVAEAFDYATLTAFLAANFRFDVQPAGDTQLANGVALFPVLPALTLSDTAGTKISFAQQNVVDLAYQAKVREYFKLLQAQFEEREKQKALKAAAEDGSVSMATLIFGRYFNMLMAQGVEAANNLLAHYPYTPAADCKLDTLADDIGDSGLANDPMRVILPNAERPVLVSGSTLALDRVVHQVRTGETFGSIAKTLADAGALNGEGQPYSAADLIAANTAAADIFAPGADLPVSGIAYSAQAHDTLNIVATRFRLRAAGARTLNMLPGLSNAALTLLQANPTAPPANATAGPVTVNTVLQPGTELTLPADVAVQLPPDGKYTTVAGDSFTLVAAYLIAAAVNRFDTSAFVKANPGLPDANATIPAGTAVQVPAVTRTLAVGDSMESIAAALLTSIDVVESSVLAADNPAADSGNQSGNQSGDSSYDESAALLAPLAVLHAPLRYAIQPDDTFNDIAQRFNLALQDLALPVLHANDPLFAAGKQLTIDSVEVIAVDRLIGDLLEQGEWNQTSGMVSRFLLSGLRLPDPRDPVFRSLTVHDLQDPRNLADIATKPLFELTGQQYAVTLPLPDDYKITITNPEAADWIGIDPKQPLQFALTERQRKLLTDIAEGALDPAVDQPSRLALFRMVPPRTALQNQIAWQAAVPPEIDASNDSESPAATGTPTIWLFPDVLVNELAHAANNNSAPLLYELVAARHTDPGQPVTTSEVGRYAWGTIVDFTITLPAAEGPAPAIANAYVVGSADDRGAAILQALYQHLAPDATGKARDNASIYLLYSPNPAGANPTGLASDAVAANSTYLLRTNLSTLTHSGGNPLMLLAASDPTSINAADLTDPASFIALLWEASITRSGGFYLNYGGGTGTTPLPETLFANGDTATLSLVVLLDSQRNSRDATMLPFNNCAVVTDNIDTTVTSVFVQPATYTVQAHDSLNSAASAFNRMWSTRYTATDAARFNATVPLLLRTGATMKVPGDTHQIAYGDTFASIAARYNTDVQTLANSNAGAEILAAQAQMQFAADVLRPQAIVSPGTIGFEITRANPDPDNTPSDQLTPAQLLGTMFNLIGWALAGSDTFLPSGAGLPVTPADSLSGSDGLSQNDADTASNEWRYSQALMAAPFAKQHSGSSSAALPSPAANPYNGIGNSVAIDLEFQDIYGNIQPFAANASPVTSPVGYFDDVIGLASWPSVAAGYTVTGAANAPVLTLVLSMQQARYIPSTAVPVDAAQAAIAADLASFTRIVYQLADPDLTFELRTTLDIDSTTAAAQGRAPKYTLERSAFVSYAQGAYTYLQALSTMAPVTAGGSAGSLSSIADAYGITVAQLLEANRERNCIELFGDATLNVPVIYSTVAGDSLASIARKRGSDALTIAQTNATIPLDPAAELTSAARSFTPDANTSLTSAAAAAQTSVTALAQANAATQGLLTAGFEFAIGTSVYTTGENDSFEVIAKALNSTVAEVAAANQWLTGIFTGVALVVNSIVPAATDTLQTLARRYTDSSIADLIRGNEDVQNLWPTASSIQVDSIAVMPLGSDSIESFAADNHVNVDQLAAANPDVVPAAELVIPSVLQHTGAPQYCTYSARPDDTIEHIAALFGSTPDELRALNPELPGAAGVWICPTMRGDAFGNNTDLSLAGLAQAYNTDPASLATANAATLGLLAAGVALPIGELTTGPNETFNSIVNRLAQLGTIMSVAEVAAALKDIPGLISAESIVLPVPPPSPATLHQAITPKFSDRVFQLAVSVVIARDPAKLDPDFADNPSVLAVTSAISPEPDAQGTLSFANFAASLQAALPGLEVATGAALTEVEAGGASTFWCVNRGNDAGSKLEYTFRVEETNYFALPPLSTSLFGGTVDITPYVSGTGLSGDAEQCTFQNIDLDVWLNTFTEAVDQFLSPACAVPAFRAQADAAIVESVVENKRTLAKVFSERVLPILEGRTTGSIEDAQTALYQALLTRLNAAYTIDAIVQVPVDVMSGGTDALSAPRLSGKLVGGGAEHGTRIPDAFSFSTAKVSLTEGASTATFLFTVKSPADHRQAQLSLQYAITEMELPDPGMVIGDYQGSSWLQFIDPLEPEPIGQVTIPIPLRAYPGPTSIVTQVARQSVAQPSRATDLLGWDFGFVYQHESAGQDTPMIAIGFNGEPAAPMAPPQSGTLTQVFDALAQFISVYPALRDDLAVLAHLEASTPATEAAVRTFAQLVQRVTDAFRPRATLAGRALVPETYAYQLHKDQDEAGMLTRLVVTSVDLVTARPQAPDHNPGHTALWPTAITATYHDPDAPNQRRTVTLELAERTDTSVSFRYPTTPAIPADTPIAHRLVFAWPDGIADNNQDDRWPLAPDSVALPQTIVFTGVDPLARQTAIAAASVIRNQALVPGFATNPAFVYRTPLTRFTSSAMPRVVADRPIQLGGAPTPVAQVLGEFLQQFFTAKDVWLPNDTIYLRLGAGYTYPIAKPGSTGLDVVVPVLLVPGVDFNPTTDCDWNEPNSFVSQVQAAIEGWRAGQTLPPGGAYTFDLTVYAEAGLLQPLIEVRSLRYTLD